MKGPYQLFKDLDTATEVALRVSIQCFGVLVPVARDQHGNILDGHQRVRIADELGIKYPVNIIEVVDGDEALEIARTLNEDRRAMPKAERLPVETALREEGHSLRAIAGVVGVGIGTVHRDLAGVPLGTPATTTGLDGKSYSARKTSPSGVRKKLPGLGLVGKADVSDVTCIYQRDSDRFVVDLPGRTVVLTADEAEALLYDLQHAVWLRCEPEGVGP